MRNFIDSDLIKDLAEIPDSLYTETGSSKFTFLVDSRLWKFIAGCGVRGKGKQGKPAVQLRISIGTRYEEMKIQLKGPCLLRHGTFSLLIDYNF